MLSDLISFLGGFVFAFVSHVARDEQLQQRLFLDHPRAILHCIIWVLCVLYGVYFLIFPDDTPMIWFFGFGLYIVGNAHLQRAKPT